MSARVATAREPELWLRPDRVDPAAAGWRCCQIMMLCVLTKFYPKSIRHHLNQVAMNRR